MRRLVTASAVVLTTAGLAASACNRGGSDDALGPTATVPQAITTTVPADPYAVPDVIDEAYINRVLAALDANFGDVTRLILETRTIPPEALDRLRAMYSSDLVQDELDLLSFEIARGLGGYREDPGNRRTTVANILSAHPSCLFAEVARDGSDVVLVAPDPRLSRQWIVLVPAGGVDRRYNTTGWILDYDGFQPGFVQPEDPCSPS